MKTGACILVALTIIVFGAHDCIKFKKTTLAIEELISLAELFKNEMKYRKASYTDLLQLGKKQGYKHIYFNESEISLVCEEKGSLSKDFLRFTEKIGTTDEQGQIALCDEYEEKLRYLLTKQRAKEESKLQINLSLSFLGALSVVIIFI